jgi:hypothetical protein
MEPQELDIEQRAIRRIASIFSISPDKIERNWRFGYELRSCFSSDFRRNELDRINDDIHDVADRKMLRDFTDGSIIVSTVGDYCDLMLRRSKEKTQKVLDVLDSAQ